MAAETVHNPDRFMADFRHIISTSGKRIGFLIGAGAPVSVRIDKVTGKLDAEGSPLMPAVAGLTTSVLGALRDKDLIAVKAIQQKLEHSPNIEHILSHIRLLERAIGSSEIYGLDGNGYKSLGETICNHIGAEVGVDLPIERTPYAELVSWISGTVRHHAVEVFTTNYDLLFEQAFERARIPYFDGFAGGVSPFFDAVTVAGDDLPARWAKLWKLHGSLGWAEENGTVVRGRGKLATHLIYPDHLKYDLTKKQPYTALFDRLGQFLSTPDTLLITCGFSFGDAHISTVIDQALAYNSRASVFAFQFQNLVDEQAASAIAHDRPNLSVYAADSAVIRGVKGRWQITESADKAWQAIRKTFWEPRAEGKDPIFTLGDFSKLARFCALASGPDLRQSADTLGLTTEPTGHSPIPPQSN
jgi:hypothetical protein